MLVWDDKSNNYPLPIAGVMGTHDNETHAFFKGTKVVCVLCPRQGGTEDSYLQVGGCVCGGGGVCGCVWGVWRGGEWRGGRELWAQGGLSGWNVPLASRSRHIGAWQTPHTHPLTHTCLLWQHTWLLALTHTLTHLSSPLPPC